MNGKPRFMWRRTAIVFLICVSMAGAAFAQTTTATLRGKISDEQGNAYPTAEIVATATASGYTHRAVAGPDGRYLLGGLTPGAYRIEVLAPAYRAATRELTLLVGQTLDIDFSLRPEAVLTEEVTVIGSAPVEMETSEVTTNVTREQINNLPQGNRNFMNFAALAPGVTVSDDELRKTFQSGAQRADAVNVFVDGVSFKNDIL